MPVVAIIGDNHFDLDNRFEECCEIHSWIVSSCEARSVAIAILTGDLYDRASRPRERNAVADFVRRLAAERPVVIVKGNHDAEQDLRILARLKTAHPVIVEEAAGVHVVGGVAVAAMAWPRKAEVLQLAESSGEAKMQAGEALRHVLRGLGAELDAHALPRVLAMHAMVRGSFTSTGQPLVGCDFEVGLDDLALVRADLYALGHVHKHQHWGINSAPVIYPGSPRRSNFGETETKGFVVAEFGAQNACSWELVETPCRHMLLWEDDWDRESKSMSHAPGPADMLGARDAEIRYRYRVDADQREGARRAAEAVRDRLLDHGAHSVRLDPQVRSVQRARVPEIAQAGSTWDKLVSMWAAQGRSVAGERADSLRSKLVEIEKERVT